MTGGLMQLVAYGAQDTYLTGNPQITFFKTVYRRHTNFSMETIRQTINGDTNTDTGKENKGSVIVSRNGDLLSKIYVTSSTVGITNGLEIIKEVSQGTVTVDTTYVEIPTNEENEKNKRLTSRGAR